MLKRTVVLLSILLPCILSASVDVTVSCQPCIRACGFANCMRVSGPGYDRQYCLQSSCNTALAAQTVTVAPCTYDFLGVRCSHDLCYTPVNRTSGCAAIPYRTTSCTSVSRVSYSCGDCPTTQASCDRTLSQCRTIKFQTTNTTNYQCLGLNCSGLTGFKAHTVDFYPCSTTTYFGTCSCCFNITTSIVGGGGLCLENLGGSTLFTDDGFMSYATNQTQSGVWSTHGTYVLQANAIKIVGILGIVALGLLY